MNPSKSSIAIKALALLALLVTQAAAYAAEAGVVTNLSGPLLAKKADGTVKVLSQKSVVEQGDLLISEKDTYARIKFIDNSEITLRPGTQLKVEKFAYEEAKPENDGVIFGLIKGGLRSITGLLGKRNHERFVLNTPTATIGIRGTTFIAEYMPENPTTAAAYARSATAALDSTYLSMSATRSDAPMTIAPIEFAPAGKFQPLYLAQNTPPGVTGALAPGLYVHVIDGIINLSNKGGSQSFSAGQFGFTGSFVQPPVILPNNPGLKFSPPPSFSSTTSSQGGTGGNKSGTVDCEVR